MVRRLVYLLADGCGWLIVTVLCLIALAAAAVFAILPDHGTPPDD